jgi:hypothetical protein
MDFYASLQEMNYETSLLNPSKQIMARQPVSVKASLFWITIQIHSFYMVGLSDQCP